MVKNTKRRYRLLKWAAWTLGGIILLAAGVALYFSAKWKPLLTEKIKEGVYNGSHHLYRIEFKNIHLNLLSGNLTLDSITLMPDTAVFDSLKKAKRAPVHLFELRLAKLQLNRISILTAYFKKRVELNAIVLQQPSINMLYNKVPKRADALEPEKTLYELIASTLRSIHVKTIKIVDADFDYFNRSRSKLPLNSVKHLNVNVKDLLIDSLTQTDTLRFMYAKDISFLLTGYEAPTKDKMYKMKIDSVLGSATAGYVKIRGFKLIPQLPDLEFSRKYPTQKDRYNLDFEEVNFLGVDFRTFNNDGNLHARKVVIGPAKVEIFMNRQLPPPDFDKGNNFPHLALRRLPVETILDTLALKNVDISYTEFSEETKKRGTILLPNLRGNILNVTNDSARVVKNNHAVADLHTSVMGKGKLAVQINFNLTAKDGAFSYTGQVGPMDLKVLNPLATNLGLVAIENGNLSSMDFSVRANLRGSSGSVHMYYNGLKINLLKKEDGKIKEKGFLSFLANNLLVINDNPKKGEELRTGSVLFSRPKTSSFFNLLWKSVFTGIRETVGIGIVPMKKPPPPKKGKK